MRSEHETLEHVADGDATAPGVRAIHVLVTGGIVELALTRVDEHKTVGKLTVVNLRARNVQRRGAHGRQVLHEQHRQSLSGYLIDRTQRQAHAMREREVLVDERTRGKRCRVELAWCK